MGYEENRIFTDPEYSSMIKQWLSGDEEHEWQAADTSACNEHQDGLLFLLYLLMKEETEENVGILKNDGTEEFISGSSLLKKSDTTAAFEQLLKEYGTGTTLELHHIEAGNRKGILRLKILESGFSLDVYGGNVNTKGYVNRYIAAKPFVVNTISTSGPVSYEYQAEDQLYIAKLFRRIVFRDYLQTPASIRQLTGMEMGKKKQPICRKWVENDAAMNAFSKSTHTYRVQTIHKRKQICFDVIPSRKLIRFRGSGKEAAEQFLQSLVHPAGSKPAPAEQSVKKTADKEAQRQYLLASAEKDAKIHAKFRELAGTPEFQENLKGFRAAALKLDPDFRLGHWSVKNIIQTGNTKALMYCIGTTSVYDDHAELNTEKHMVLTCNVDNPDYCNAAAVFLAAEVMALQETAGNAPAELWVKYPDCLQAADEAFIQKFSRLLFDMLKERLVLVKHCLGNEYGQEFRMEHGILTISSFRDDSQQQ